MKCSLGISDFLEEISSLSHSIIFLSLFALITQECFHISRCYSLELFIHMGISFLFSFVYHFSSFVSYLYQGTLSHVRKKTIVMRCEGKESHHKLYTTKKKIYRVYYFCYIFLTERFFSHYIIIKYASCSVFEGNSFTQ